MKTENKKDPHQQFNGTSLHVATRISNQVKKFYIQPTKTNEMNKRALQHHHRKNNCRYRMQKTHKNSARDGWTLSWKDGWMNDCINGLTDTCIHTITFIHAHIRQPKTSLNISNTKSHLAAASCNTNNHSHCIVLVVVCHHKVTRGANSFTPFSFPFRCWHNKMKFTEWISFKSKYR